MTPSDLLVTGKFQHGRFRHELPERLADLLEDLAQALRKGGSDSIHAARVLSSPRAADVAETALEPGPFEHVLQNLVDTMDRAWHDCRNLHVQVSNLTAHAERVNDYEEGGCISCKRNAGHWEPIEPRYAKYCKWCRMYRQAHDGQLPPIPILSARHRGARITVAMIEAHAGQKAS